MFRSQDHIQGAKLFLAKVTFLKNTLTLFLVKVTFLKHTQSVFLKM